MERTVLTAMECLCLEETACVPLLRKEALHFPPDDPPVEKEVGGQLGHGSFQFFLAPVNLEFVSRNSSVALMRPAPREER